MKYEEKKIKEKVISSIIWKLLEKGGNQGVQFIVQLILARLLIPEDFGLVAIVLVFIQIANVFVQSGFNTALIQKKDADEIDFSSIFFLSLLVAGSLYGVLFFLAPFIAGFYQDNSLISIIRVLSITLFFGAFNSIQMAFVARKMAFQKLFFSSFAAILISGTLGITAAYLGWGIWALVAHQISNRLLITIILWFTLGWKPKLVFSINRVKELFSFGSKLLLSDLLNAIYRDIRSLIIGRIYNPTMLGFYNRGEQFPKIIVQNFDGAIQSVMLPAFSSHQDDLKIVKNMMRRAIVTSSFIMFPMMIGLAAIAEPVVSLVLTDKWLPAVPFLQIFCAIYALRPIHTANLKAIQGLGRSDIFLKLEVIKKLVGVLILFLSIQYGIYAIAFGQFLSGIVSTFINAYPNKKLLGYNYFEQLKDISPSLFVSIIMGVIVYLVGFLPLTIGQLLFSQISLGIIIFFGLAKIFRVDILYYLINTIKKIFYPL